MEQKSNMKSLNNNNMNDKLIKEYNLVYNYNDREISNLYSGLNLSLIYETCKMSNVQDFTIAIFGAISALFNGPRSSWQQIREYIIKNDIIAKLPKYSTLSKFYSLNRILDDYNKVKSLNITQTSIDYSNLLKIYLLIVDNLEILIKLEEINSNN